MKKAFTIIEAIVALGIFGLGVLAVVSFFIYSSQFTRLARQTTISSNLVEQTMEETIALPYSSLIPATGSRTRFSSDQSSPYYSYEKQINITLVNSSLANSATDVGLKKINVLVFWQAGTQEKSVELATVVGSK
jgi:Tfp pilus assembly protein PilV